MNNKTPRILIPSSIKSINTCLKSQQIYDRKLPLINDNEGVILDAEILENEEEIKPE